jgi:hypothetical protein
MNDVMLDFETLGNGTNKCICQVGAVYFNNITGELGEEFKANIDASSHEAIGGRLDAKTVYWWLQQSEAARKSFADNLQPIELAFNNLNQFLSKAKRVWSHSTFDFVTLMETMKQLNIKPSVSYKSGLDLRTLVYLGGTGVDKTPREGVHHDALDDCKFQVKYAVTALNAVKTSKRLIKYAEGLQE